MSALLFYYFLFVIASCVGGIIIYKVFDKVLDFVCEFIESI